MFFLHKGRHLGLLAASLFAVSMASAQIASMPPQSGVFTGNTRGYYFTAPTSFIMTGIRVLPQDGGTATLQNFAVVRFDGAVPPPVFSATTNAFSPLALGFDQAGGVFAPINVLVNAGDVIGVYGNMTTAIGATSGQASYGNGSLGTTIFGNSVTLNRSGMQFHLGQSTSPNGMHDLWSEPTSTNITRIEFTYSQVPEPASLAALGLGALAMLRRRRANQQR